MQAATSANLWHRRLGQRNRKSLDLLTNHDNNWVSFDGTVPDCDVSAVGGGHQLARPKTADHKAKLPFQLVFADLMRPLTPEALGGVQERHQHLRWVHQVDGDLHLLKSKHYAFSSFQIFVQSEVIPRVFGVERLWADKGGEFTGKEFQTYCLQTGVSLEFASTPAPTCHRKSGCPSSLEFASTSAPTRHRKWVCPSALEEL